MTNKSTDSSQGGGGNLPPPAAAPPGGPCQPDQTNARGGNKVYKSGPLFLSSRGIGWTSWKKRWFILTQTSLVFFRHDPNSIPPKGSEVNLTLGGIDLNSSGSVVVKADKKLLTVLFPDGRDGRAFTLKAETSEDLFEWKAALEEALANAPSATLVMGKNGILKNEQPGAADASLEQSKDRQTAKSLVIGRPILLALEDIDGTPSFLEKALRFLEEHGVKVEGILRQAADVDDVEHRIREFEQGKNEFSPNEDPHVIADCIKYIIRELPSSPVPASCCNALLEAFRTDRGKRVSAMRAAICETFPEPNRRLLQRILMMMQTVASHKAVNRMSTSAVAACMAPLLLRPLLAGDCELENDFDMGGDGSVQLLQAAAAANHAQAIVITLLEEYDTFFGEGSMSSELYSDSEASGSESEELCDDGSFEDEGEDDATEGSDAYLDEDFEHASNGSCTATGDSEDNNLYDDKMQGSKSPEVDDNVEVGLKISSRPPQNSVHQHDIVGESEHILDHSTSGSAVQANASDEVVQEVLAESSPENQLTNKSASTCIQKTATLSNGPGRSTRRPAHWGRTPGRKNLSMESMEFGIEDEFEIERLEVIKTELQSRIAEEAKANAILQENLEKHKNALYERRLTLEQDVARLQEQLQKEIELRTTLEARLKMSEGVSPIAGTVEAEVEDIAQSEADVTNLKQKADDLAVQLNQQNEQNRDFIPDACILPEKYTNHQGKLKDKQKDLEATSTNRTFDKSTRNKGQSNKADAEKDVKQDPSSINKNVPQNQQSDLVHNSKYAGIPPTSSSAESVTAGKPATINSKRQGTRGEGATSTTSALSKLTNRLNFLKERRTQIASEIQNFDKGHAPGQPAQNSEGHSSVKSRGADQNSEGPSASSTLSVQNMDWRRRSDGLTSPNLERGKSDGFPNVDKGQIPSRTLSR